uniref:Uncharacterized protein n=1 Tax=Rhizophora mucronata TaxID=61149 RepID=A0A2P2QKZ0_RHIMU
MLFTLSVPTSPEGLYHYCMGYFTATVFVGHMYRIDGCAAICGLAQLVTWPQLKKSVWANINYGMHPNSLSCL